MFNYALLITSIGSAHPGRCTERAGMNKTSSKKSNVIALLATIVLSSVTMLVLLWRFPVTTALITLAVLAAFGISARLARWIEVDRNDLDHSEHLNV
jgi:CHASE2 domain-containing sensor protein